MTDKILSVPRQRLGPRIGSVDADTLAQVDRALAALLGLG
jgi:mRNA-degrading endonuclease toxin of MazEF toxin-antitoxin module